MHIKGKGGRCPFSHRKASVGAQRSPLYGGGNWGETSIWGSITKEAIRFDQGRKNLVGYVNGFPKPNITRWILEKKKRGGK